MEKREKSDFEKYMNAGYSLREACRLSGLTLPEARKLIAQNNSDFEDWELLRQHGTKKIREALDILGDLMNSSEESISLGAVRTLIDVMKPIQKKSLVKIEVDEAEDDIWTYAKNKSDDNL